MDGQGEIFASLLCAEGAAWVESGSARITPVNQNFRQSRLRILSKRYCQFYLNKYVYMFNFEYPPKETKIESELENKIDLLKDYVKEVYSKSAEGDPKKEMQVKEFNRHNEDILDFIEELTKEEKISPEDMEAAKLAAVLHDVAKFDAPLIKHGFEGAKIAEKKLKELNFDEKTIQQVKNSIERHMGPIPGFMENEAKKWEEQTGEKIEFPRPKNTVDKALYDADMLSLISFHGIEKILTIRKNTDIFQEEDEKTAAKEGITIEEARWRSALKSAYEAADSLFSESAKRKANQFLTEMEEFTKKSLNKKIA
ncbi:HD domain-containing protein [Candidatus Shapirobacteria bacterium]|nr:HD domain-containing protein [Candidatus Shapirobacteria bacterium]